MFFEIDNKSVVKSADFSKEIGTLYDLLIYLFDNPINAVTSAQIQGDFFKPITTLKNNYFKPKNWHYRSEWRTKKENFCKTRKCSE